MKKPPSGRLVIHAGTPSRYWGNKKHPVLAPLSIWNKKLSYHLPAPWGDAR